MGTENEGIVARPASARVKVKRGAKKGFYGTDDVLEVLDAGMIAHVGVETPQGPLVLPMAYGHDKTNLYLHGALANQLLGTGDGHEVCVTVTLVDGLVVARAPFHNSMNYRSVVVRGEAQRLAGNDDKLAALKCITNHIAPIFEHGRHPTESELRRTLVLRLPLTESSAKIRTGDPKDDLEDLDGPWWAGVVPVTSHFAAPIPSGNLPSGVNPSAPLTDLEGCQTDDRPIQSTKLYD